MAYMKIGEKKVYEGILQKFKGKQFEVVSCSSCDKCVFYNEGDLCYKYLYNELSDCASMARKDGKDIIFREVQNKGFYKQ